MTLGALGGGTAQALTAVATRTAVMTGARHMGAIPLATSAEADDPFQTPAVAGNPIQTPAVAGYPIQTPAAAGDQIRKS